MNCKEHRTLDLYIDTAAKVKLLHDLLLDAQVGLSQIIPRKYVDRLRRAESALIEIRDEAERMSLAEACEIAGLPYKQVFHRIVKANWPVEKALSEPMRGPSELKRKCKEHGMDYHRVYNRIYVYGWTEEEALNTPIGAPRR